MICISINTVQPAITDPDLMQHPWWAASRKILTGKQWIYDFFKQSIDNEIIFPFSHQAPETLTCDSPMCSKYFSSSMENAQVFTNDVSFLQALEMFENNGYTITVTLEEISAVDLDNLKNPQVGWKLGWIEYIIDPDSGWFDNMPFNETYTEFLSMK